MTRKLTTRAKAFDPTATDIRIALRDATKAEALEIWKKCRKAMDPAEAWWWGSDGRLRAVRLTNPGAGLGRGKQGEKLAFHVRRRYIQDPELRHGAARRVDGCYAHERRQWARMWKTAKADCGYTPIALDVRGRLGF